MTDYLITFFDEAGKTLGALRCAAWSHWDACAWAWDNCPKGSDDFQCEAVG